MFPPPQLLTRILGSKMQGFDKSGFKSTQILWKNQANDAPCFHITKVLLEYIQVCLTCL